MALILATASGILTIFKAMISNAYSCPSKKNLEKLLTRAFYPAVAVMLINSAISITIALFFNDLTDHEQQIAQAIKITEAFAYLGILAVCLYLWRCIRKLKIPNEL